METGWYCGSSSHGPITILFGDHDHKLERIYYYVELAKNYRIVRKYCGLDRFGDYVY